MSTRRCCGCGIEKLHEKKSYNEKQKRWTYVDAEGSPWDGQTCGKCRAPKKLQAAKSKRKCVVCGRSLPQGRYYRHEGCKDHALTHHDMGAIHHLGEYGSY